MVDPTANHTLANGLKLLQRLASEYREFSIAELAREFDRPKSHVHRLLQTLVESGLVVHSPETRRYRVGYRLLALAGTMADQMPLRRLGRPVLRTLSEAARNSSYLIVPDGDAPLVIMSDHQGGRHRNGSLGLGQRLQAHASASGKLFLAYRLIQPPARPFTRLTGRTITSEEEFAAELKRIRRNGYSVNRAENNEVTYSFAAPVFSVGEPIAAVGLAAARPLVEERGEAEFIQFAVDAAETLSNLC